jgi:SnoaL-like domain
MTDTTPDVVTRYLRAADAKDPQACADCFTKTGTVLDEGVTYRGRDDIKSWRETTLGKWTYTTEVTGSIPITPDEHQVTVHVAGDFPGGQADLTYSFTLQDDLIAALKIVEPTS